MFSSLSLILDGTLDATLGSKAAPGNGIPQSARTMRCASAASALSSVATTASANPQGTNTRDLEHFVTHFGFSPSAAPQAATRAGGEIMQRGHELGLVKEGYLADLLLVDGDPLEGYRRAAGQAALCLHHERRRALHAARRGTTCQARALTAVCVNAHGCEESKVGCLAARRSWGYSVVIAISSSFVVAAGVLDGFVILFYGRGHEHN
jgi:Amidohydrolase family